MKRAAVVLVLVFLLILLLFVPIGMGAGMPGMLCPDCTLPGSSVVCLVLSLIAMATLAVGRMVGRIRVALVPVPIDDATRILERPPR